MQILFRGIPEIHQCDSVRLKFQINIPDPRCSRAVTADNLILNSHSTRVRRR